MSATSAAAARRPLVEVAISSIAVRSLPSVTSVSRDAWNSLFPSAAEDWDYFRSCERAAPPGFSLSAIGAFADNVLVGAAPLFRVDFRLDMPLDRGLQPVASWLNARAPRLMNRGVLAIGSPHAEECPIGILPSVTATERTLIFKALLEGLYDSAAATSTPLLVLKDVRDRDTLWVQEPLRRAGFVRIPMLPVAVLELPYRHEDEYLSTLSPRLRSELRRKMRQASEVRVELRTSIDDLRDEINALFQATRGYRRADYGAFDDVGPDYFTEVTRNLGGRAQVMLCHLNGELVSFNMFLVEQHRVLAKYIGMRYPQARELNLYYFNWVMMVRYCIEHGISAFQTGQTAYEIKLRLGSKLKRSWIYVRHRGLFMNQLVRAIGPLMAFDKTDPDLRELGDKAPFLAPGDPAA